MSAGHQRSVWVRGGEVFGETGDMSGGSPAPNRPFRWDLVRRDQLGSLLAGSDEPDLWFLEELIACAAKVLARSGDGDLYFVGRSLDSVYDLLGGALAETSWRDRVFAVPISLQTYGDRLLLTQRETAQLRANLAAAGLSPDRIARQRPAVMVDLVLRGSTFGGLFGELRDWVDDERGDWAAVRRKLRFVGITYRTKTSPKTHRWWQDADWLDGLPAGAVTNVSVDPDAYLYFADDQTKLTRSFDRGLWADDGVRSPARDAVTRQALAEAVAVVERGRTAEVRAQLARHLSAEPTIKQSWLRALARDLRR